MWQDDESICRESHILEARKKRKKKFNSNFFLIFNILESLNLVLNTTFNYYFLFIVSFNICK